MRAPPRLTRRIAAAALTLAATPLSAAGPAFRLNLGLGLVGVLGADRHEQVYGATAGAFEFGVEADFENRWHLAATAARGEATGTDVLRVAEPTRTDSRFRTTTLDLTAGRIFALSPRWRLLAGAGASALHWREENDLLDREDSGWGGHLALGLRREGGAWAWGLGLRGVWIPGALEDRAGTSTAISKEDYRAVVLSLTASHVLREEGGKRPRPTSGIPSGARDWELRLSAGPVLAAHTWRFAGSPVSRATADHDPYPELGLGVEVPVGGPFAVALDLGYGKVDLESRVDYFNTGTSFVSSGRSEAWTGTLGLPVRILKRPGAELRLVPVVAYLRYDVSTRGGFTLEGTDQLWTAGLGLASRIGAGPWGLHLALRHLGLVRLQSNFGAFEFQPVDLEVGVSWRPGRAR